MSESHLRRLMSDRSRGLTPERARRGISYADELRGLKEMEALVLIASGLFSEMSVDGFDHTTRIGKNLVRMRAVLDTLEVCIEREPVNEVGEYGI